MAAPSENTAPASGQQAVAPANRPALSATDREVCRCGQARIWHRDGTGPCELTGPQIGDGCDCKGFR